MLQTEQTPSEMPKATQQSAPSQRIWPLHPLLLASIIPVIPTSLYVNRGLTVWFHWMILFYLLTGIERLRCFLILLGGSISAGWYAAIANDFFRHSRFFDILYENMPLSFLSVMTNGKGEIVYTTSSLCLMAFSHVLDTFLHPGVTYLLWRAHCRSGGSLQSIITWPLLISTFLMSRFWSIFHIYYNYRRLGLYYIGDDVYKLNNQDAYIYAYTAEGIFFLMLACSKILKRSDKEI